MATETAKLYDNIKITQLENSEIEIEGEIPVSVIPAYRTKALKKLGENAKIDGFRKGHIPEKVLIGKVGEDKIMGEVAEMILAHMYPTLVRDKNLDVIGAPEVMITKLAPGNPIGFKIKSAVLPQFSLPDYMEIAKEVLYGKDVSKDDLEVTEADIEKVLTEVRRGKARFEKAQKQTKKETTEKTGEKAETGKADSPDQPKADLEEDLPELDDAFISTLGDFKTVEDFEARVREDLGKEKVQKAHNKKRIKLSEQLIEKTNMILPKILIESELDKMMGQMKDDTTRMNMKFEDYLTHVKKSEEDLRNEWKAQAEKRAKLQLLLNDIAKKEGISAEEGAVRHEVERILERFKDANKDNVHIYVETQFVNEAVFKFLEGNEEKITKVVVEK